MSIFYLDIYLGCKGPGPGHGDISTQNTQAGPGHLESLVCVRERQQGSAQAEVAVGAGEVELGGRRQQLLRVRHVHHRLSAQQGGVKLGLVSQSAAGHLVEQREGLLEPAPGHVGQPLLVVDGPVQRVLQRPHLRSGEVRG